MSTYDKASLVLIPSGTKEGVVFSQKPTNGDGDFTFSRASAATRVNSDGLIEKETQNLATYSNTFNSWSLNTGITETSGQSGYDGFSDAWRIDLTSSSGRLQESNTTSGVQTFSVYAKAGSLDFIRVFARDVSDLNPSTYFNLLNGTIGTQNAVISATIKNVGNGWYRCEIVFTKTIQDVRIYPAQADNDLTATSGNIYIQDAQLNQGLVADSYLETTTAAVYEGITDNIPRLDYTDASCPSLLLEPQRTNICPNSEDVSNWSLTFATATPNDTISPEGVQNAAKIVTSNSGCDVKLTSIPVSPSTTYTASFYCKLTSGSGLQTRFYDNTNGANIEYYTYDSQIAVGEWKRVTRTFTTPAGCNNIQIWFLAASSSASVTAHYWGYQLEEASYATSYIPTYGASVTRVADECSINDFQSNGIFGADSGSIFFDFGDDFTIFDGVPSGSPTDLFQFVDITSYGGGYMRFRGDEFTHYLQLVNMGADDNSLNFSRESKLCICWDSNGVDFYGNGALIQSTTITNAPSFDRLERGITGNGREARIKEVLFFTTKLSSQEAIALTTI